MARNNKNGAVIAIEFDYRNSIRDFINNYKKEFRELKDSGLYDNLGEDIKQRLQEVSKWIEKFEIQYKTDLANLGKEKLNASEFQEFAKEFRNRTAEIEGDILSLQKAFRGIDGGDGLLKIIDQYTKLQEVVETTRKTVLSFAGMRNQIEVSLGNPQRISKSIRDEAEALSEEIGKLFSGISNNTNLPTAESIELIKKYAKEIKAVNESATSETTDEELSIIDGKVVVLAKHIQDLVDVNNKRKADVEKEISYLSTLDKQNKLTEQQKDNLIKLREEAESLRLIDLETATGMTPRGLSTIVNGYETVAEELDKIASSAKEAESSVKNLNEDSVTVTEFSIKNGHISVPVKLGTNFKTLSKELFEWVSKLQTQLEKDKIKIPVVLTSDYNSDTAKKDIKTLKSQMQGELKNSGETGLEQYADNSIQKAVSKSVTYATNVIKEINDQLEKYDFTIHPKVKFELDEDAYNEIQKKVQEEVKTSVAVNLEELEKAVNNLYDTSKVQSWGAEFVKQIKDIANNLGQLDPLSVLHESGSDDSNVITKKNNTTLTTDDVNSMSADLSQLLPILDSIKTYVIAIRGENNDPLGLRTSLSNGTIQKLNEVLQIIQAIHDKLLDVQPIFNKILNAGSSENDQSPISSPVENDSGKGITINTDGLNQSRAVLEDVNRLASSIKETISGFAISDLFIQQINDFQARIVDISQNIDKISGDNGQEIKGNLISISEGLSSIAENSSGAEVLKGLKLNLFKSNFDSDFQKLEKIKNLLINLGTGALAGYGNAIAKYLTAITEAAKGLNGNTKYLKEILTIKPTEGFAEALEGLSSADRDMGRISQAINTNNIQTVIAGLTTLIQSKDTFREFGAAIFSVVTSVRDVMRTYDEFAHDMYLIKEGLQIFKEFGHDGYQQFTDEDVQHIQQMADHLIPVRQAVESFASEDTIKATKKGADDLGAIIREFSGSIDLGKTNNLKTIAERITAFRNAITDGAFSDQSDQIATVKNNIQDLISAFNNGDKTDYTILDKLPKFAIKEDLSEKLSQATIGFTALLEVLKDISGPSQTFVTSIANILEKSKELEHFASILKATTKKVNEAKDAAITNEEKENQQRSKDAYEIIIKNLGQIKSYRDKIAKAGGNQEIIKNYDLEIARLQQINKEQQKIIDQTKKRDPKSDATIDRLQKELELEQKNQTIKAKEAATDQSRRERQKYVTDMYSTMANNMKRVLDLQKQLLNPKNRGVIDEQSIRAEMDALLSENKQLKARLDLAQYKKFRDTTKDTAYTAQVEKYEQNDKAFSNQKRAAQAYDDIEVKLKQIRSLEMETQALRQQYAKDGNVNIQSQIVAHEQLIKTLEEEITANQNLINQLDLVDKKREADNATYVKDTAKLLKSSNSAFISEQAIAQNTKDWGNAMEAVKGYLGAFKEVQSITSQYRRDPSDGKNYLVSYKLTGALKETGELRTITVGLNGDLLIQKDTVADVTKQVKLATSAMATYDKVVKSIYSGKEGGFAEHEQELNNAQAAYNLAIETLKAYKSYHGQELIDVQQIDAAIAKLQTEMDELQARRKAAITASASQFDSQIAAIELAKTDKIEEYNNQLARLKALRDEYYSLKNAPVDTITTEDAVRIQNLEKEIRNLIKDLTVANGKWDQFNKNGQITTFAGTWEDATKSVEDYTKSLDGVVSSSVSIKRVSAGSQNLVVTYQKINGEAIKQRYIWDANAKAFRTFGQEVSSANFFTRLGEEVKKTAGYFAHYMSGYMVVQRVISGIREAISTIKELDKQFTEMRKVSDLSTESLQNYVDAAFDVAKAVGTTNTALLSSTADYMRIGESLNSAAELAKNTVILMNVSEFENINDATDALIAMKQAYQELGSMDIIDKLNNIGNNFSISTSDLAQSLQKSAGTLRVAGNDINEAIALTVAGNAILQDPAKVAAGVRTISLRITGTKAAKEELESLEEDVSDFVVTTSSKLNDQVKGLTKTLGNNFEGVSLLDDNGNYRSTYEILQDIADVWDEIKEADIKTGENRQNALLELLAGKNRSNVLASILNDGDLLRQVYESAQDSAGSAMREQEKYLDSIEGKLNVLTTSTEKFWYSLIDSNLVKTGIDFITQIVDGATKLVDLLNNVPAILTIIGGALGAKGFGLFNVDLNSGQVTNIFTQISSLFDNTKEYKRALSLLNSEVDGISGSFEQWGKNNQITNKSLMDLLKTADKTGLTTRDVTEQLEKGSLVASKMGSALLNLATNAAIFFAITITVQAVTKAIDDAYTSVQEYENNINNLEGEVSDLNAQIKTLQDLQKDGTITSEEQARLEILKKQKQNLEDQIERAETLAAKTKIGTEQILSLAGLDSDTYVNRYRARMDTQNRFNTTAYEPLQMLSVSQDDLSLPEETFKQTQTNAANQLKANYEQSKELAADYISEILSIQETLLELDENSSEYKLGQELIDNYEVWLQQLWDVQAAYHQYGNLQEEDYLSSVQAVVKELSILDENWSEMDVTKLIATINRIFHGIVPEGIVESLQSMGYSINDIFGGWYDANWAMNNVDGTGKNVEVTLANINKQLEKQVTFTDEATENMDALTNAYSDYTSQFNTLIDAQQKIKNGTITKDDVRNLMMEFPDLAPYIDLNDSENYGQLYQGISNVYDQLVEDTRNDLEAAYQKIFDSELLGGAINDEVVAVYEDVKGTIASLSDQGYDIGNLIFGNVDVYAREGLTITEDNLAKYSEALESWGKNAESSVGETFTSFAKTGVFTDNADNQISIAFTPVLHTDSGDVLLSKEQISAYWDALLQEAFSEYDATGALSKDTILAIDAKGLEVDGQVIQGIFADIGDTAEATATAMNTYDYGSNQLSFLKSEADAAGASFEDFVQKLINSEEINNRLLAISKVASELGGENDRALAKIAEDYENVTSEINELAGAIDNLLSGSMTAEDVISLMQKFPELMEFDDIDLNDDLGFGNLYNHLLDLIDVRPDALVAEMKELRDSLPDGEDRNKLTMFIDALNRMSDIGRTGLDANALVDTSIWDDTNHVIETTLSYYDDLAKLNELVADGFVVTAEKASELINIFPQLAEGIEEYGVAGDGMIKLNEDVVNGILEGSDTSIDAQIAALESEKATLEGRRAATEARLEMAKAALESESRFEKEKALYELELAEQTANEQIEADRVVAEQDAQAKQDEIDNNVLVGESTMELGQAITTNIGSGVAAAATSFASNMASMQQSTDNTIGNVHNLATAVANAGKGIVAGAQLGTRTSGSRGYVAGRAKGVSKKTTTSNLSDADLNLKIGDYIADLELDLAAYNQAISKIDGQITVLRNLQGGLKDRFKTTGADSGSGGGGGGGGGGSDASDAADEFSELYDWIEIAIKRIEERIERLDKTAGDTYTTLSVRNNALKGELSAVRDEIALQQEAYATYMAVAEGVDLPEEYKKKVREGMLQIETITDETLSNAIEQYQEWYDKAIACSDAIQDLTMNLGDLHEQNFELYESASDNVLDEIEHRATMIENGLAKAEARGYLTAQKYYDALLVVENETFESLNKKRDQLVKELAEAVSSGSIEVYSESWYGMQSAIDSVTEALQESKIQMIEYDNSIRDLHWERFDYLQERINQITEETEFFIKLLETTDLFTDNGNITNAGQSTFGLYAINYDTYLKQATMYADELKKIEKDLASDPYDTVLIERREELLKLQREAIENAQDEKEAIKDLVSDGFDKFLDSLKDSIDSYKELMSEWQDTYQFQKDIEEAAKQITNLEKTVAAYTNDDSEYGMLMRQQTQNSLDEARQSLEEKQRDHYLSETEKILDELYSNAEELLNARLDNIDQLMIDIIDQVNANSGVIGDTLREVAEENGLTISNAMETIWSGAEGIEYSITPYLEKIGEIPSGVVTAISNIEEFVRTLAKAAEDEASAEVKAEEAENIANTVTKEVANKIAPVPTKTTTNATKTTSSSNTSNTSATTSSTSSATASAAKGGFFSKLPFRGNKSALAINTSIVDRLNKIGPLYHNT